ncbi:phospholipase [Altericroceibacterium spongiae]|uniref:Phospholipase A1 n=1 Tax=Altericroceibacterium spongiae TaxID=2320269 RepID=A0A420ECK0_9SPHN|nr:phospholipase A [Altericroceibacterium spongiae]RKF18396.1 phospholipase [Altericroceibacterium spongiae]
MKKYCLLSALLLSAAPASVMAQAPVEAVVSRATTNPTDHNEEKGEVTVELRFLNNSDTQQTVALPDRVEAHLDRSGVDQSQTLWLQRDPIYDSSLIIPAGGFAAAKYHAKTKAIPDSTLISVPAWSGQQVVLLRRERSTLANAAKDAKEPIEAAQAYSAEDANNTDLAVDDSQSPLPAPPPTDRAASNAFIDNLSAYQPIYAVYGPGTNTEARLQISFKYQLFGSHNKRPDFSSSWRDGLHFAYTQRMFWDVRADSFPFRNIDFQPELIYITPSTTLDNGMTLAAQGGLRHESNGKDGDDSRTLNSLYISPMASIPVGDETALTIMPRLAFYVGGQTGNEDIERYRGHASLQMDVGKENGLRLTTNTRFNFSSGKGSFAADLSYPLPNLWKGGPEVYLYGQSFFGYGENLLDYNRKVNRVRVGIAFVR